MTRINGDRHTSKQTEHGMCSAITDRF